MNKSFRIYIFLLFAGVSVIAAAQAVSSSEISPDARSTGLANASVGVEANAFAVYKNTAAISFADKQMAAAYSYTDWYGKNNLHAIGAYYQLNPNHALTLGARYFDAEKVFVSPDGISGKEVNPYDLMIDLGYAFRLNKLLSISANARYINSKISEGEGIKKGNAFSFDLGAHFRKDAYSAGITLSGLGTAIDYGFGNYKLPARLLFGGAYTFTPCTVHRLQVSLEGEYRFIPSGSEYLGGGAGLEYTYNGMFALRGGYRLGDKEKSPGNYGVVGCGIYVNCFTIDFAYTLAKYDSMLRDVWQLSLGVRF